MKFYFSILIFIFVSCSNKTIPTKLENELEPVTLKAYVDKAAISSKETVNFYIELIHEKNIDLDIPEVGARIEALRILDAGQVRPRIFGNHIEKKRWYKLQGDVAGTYVLPSVELSYDLNNEKKSIKTSEIFIEIKNSPETVTPEKDIRDIKGIVSKPIRYWLFLIAILLLILGSVVATKLYKKLHRKKVELRLPVHEVALSRLKELKNKFPKNQEQIKPFFFSLSDVLREYFENRFGLNVTDLTLYEIKNRINEIVELPDNSKKDYLRLLEEADLVKFTDFKPKEENIFRFLENSENFVISTKEKPKEVVA